MQDIELNSRHDSALSLNDGPHFSLPRADGGREAWLVLGSAFILEALVWGFPFAFGVFQEHYTSHELFSDDLASIAAIGTTATGIMYFAAPLVYGVLRRFPQYRKTCSVFGFVVLLAGLIGASFATTVPQLLATQGVLYAIGGSLHYFPAFLYLDEWFIQRKGIAYGTVWAGAGASGIAIPLTMEWILRTWGFRTALRTWAVVTIILTTPALIFMKPRLPDQHADMGPKKVDLSFLKSPAFWMLQLGNIIQGLGYFMPSLYLPSFATAQGWSSLSGTIAVSLCNAANVIGATFTGWLVDRYHVTTAINICAIGTVVAVFLFWSFAIYQPILYIFAILYGVFAGGFSATWSGCTNPVRRHYPAVETGMIIAFFSAGKGIGAVISGPLSGALVQSDTWKHHAGYAYGSGYGYLIVFSGITASFASIPWFGKLCGIVS
ncbi:putative MFS monocarboxylate transporter [Diplogelasinospora grovesii]|uniref:MFS monocarboxylate transporter n=1 Tax=Diplogelasinospora grovesii TaxID=303347 RepID=A0AAN6S1I4_9PEZI|nr:putative MFS monocarboxylate transporter [Diplogelasinospora grovesii]